jgi:hypothetical protein
MRRNVPRRTRIPISNLRRTLLLDLPTSKVQQNNHIIHQRLDLGHWELDHHTIREFRLRLHALRRNINVSPRLERKQLATPPYLLRRLSRLPSYLHLCKSLPAPSRYSLRRLDSRNNPREPPSKPTQAATPPHTPYPTTTNPSPAGAASPYSSASSQQHIPSPP